MLLQLEYTRFDGTTSGKEKIVDLADGLANHGHTISEIDGLGNQLAGVTGGLVYKGTWDPSTEPLPSGESGWYYVVNGSGTVGGVDYQPKDMILHNGTTWDKIDNTDSVTSVNAQTGAVTLTIPSHIQDLDGSQDLDLTLLGSLPNYITSYPDPTGATQGYVLKKTSSGSGLAFQPTFSGSYTDLTNKPTDLHTHANKQWIDMVPHPGSALAGQVLKPTNPTTIGWGSVDWDDVTFKPPMAPSNATANSSDATLLDRQNHTGTQPISTIEGLQTLLDNLNAGLSFQGDWDPTTGSYPPGTDGHYWIVSAPGEVSGVDYMPRDWIVWNGIAWIKIDNTDRVKSVNGVEPDETGNIAIEAGGSLQSETITSLSANETRQITLGLPILAIVENEYTLQEV
jgi:hypothetical protein